MCFEEDVTERSHFPCGHFVCTACNATLLQRGFLNCPTCRTPRNGVSQAAVEHASQQRVLQNEADERGDGGMGVGMTISHAGQRYRILFFPDESQGSPFATLGRQDMGGWPAPGGRGARAMRPMRAARTLRMMPPYHSRSPLSSLQNRTRRREGGQAEEEEEEEEEEGEGEEENREGAPRAHRPPGEPMTLDPSMERLVDGLLNPVDVSEFLARRQRV